MRRLYSDIIDNIVALRIAIATSILVIVFALGSTGYYFVEDMTFITNTTIGFSELKNLSAVGRILTMIFFIMGIGVISYIASQTMQLLFESELFRRRV